MASQDSEKAVDFAYLEDFMAGDRQVIGEVLALFVQQAAIWSPGLDGGNPGWRDLVHTIKGAALGIGANALGAAAASAEAASAPDLEPVRAALAAALAEIADYRSEA